jgi:formiminoglutamase
MPASLLPKDPMWPRAADWLVPARPADAPHGDLAIVGVPAFRSSISATGAYSTPRAVRDALGRYSTFAGGRGIDISTLRAVDLGDIDDPDGPDGEARVKDFVEHVRERFALLIAIGGDNSITNSVMRGQVPEPLRDCGLITVDAHHDLRDGESNGSPVRRLVEAGLPGENIVQIGIADFANSAAYAARAMEYGITVVTRADLRGADLLKVVARALHIAGRHGRPVYVDLDVDVVDRSAAPGCPASAPGGISPDELRQLAYLFALDPRVRGMDITEVDANADAADQRTVRLAAMLVLEAAAGLAVRLGHR